MLNLIAILAVVITGTAVSRLFPTEDLLQDQFALGQNYYAANDHGNAVRVFGEIEKTPNYALLEVDGIEVTIGELTLPLRQAATYQLGNSYRNVARTQLDRAENATAEGDSATSKLRLGEAREAFSAAKKHYRRLIENPNAATDLRAMAQYQVIRANYQMGDFAEVVGQVSYLRQYFPDSEYEKDGIYDQGWAEYYMSRYQNAIDTFAEFLGSTTDALKRDRAIFQSAESHYALGGYEAARSGYGRLVSLYDFGAMSDKELKTMKTERLRGLVQETTRELVAKAQIRIADAFGEEGMLDEAVDAYSLVPTRYPQETPLVQRSYENMASLLQERRGVDAGVAVLRRAIDQIEDPQFRGRAQFRIATLLYGEGRFEEALEDLRVYVRGYGDIAVSVGVDLDRVYFLMAEARRLNADEAAEGDGHAAEGYAAAADHYRRVMTRYPRSSRLAESHYGLGLSHFGLGQVDSSLVHLAAAVDEHPASEVAPFALSWRGRLEARRGNYESAVIPYRRLIKEYPKSGLVDQTWRDLGLVHKQLGDTESALRAFAEVTEDSPAWPKVQAEAGDMLLAERRVSELASQFDIDGALARTEAAGDDETTAELHYIRGRMARDMGDSATEIEHLTAALERSGNPQLGAFCLFFRALASFRLGTANDAAGDTLAAAEKFGSSVSDLEHLLSDAVDIATPEMRSVAYRTRGVALTRLSRSEEAVVNYRILIASAAAPEERSDFELMLMELYYDLEQLDETAKTARDIIAAEFQDDNTAGFYKKERAHLVLTSVLLETEQYRETVRTAREAIARYPGSAELATLRLASARALFSLEDYAEAARAFDTFLAWHPDNVETPAAYYQLGYAHELLGNYDDAATAFGTLAERFPEQEVAPEAQYRSGENLYNSGRFEEALIPYREVGLRYPGSAAAEKAMYSAAWTYMDLEREADSIDAMRRLVAEFPQGRYARLAQFSIGDYAYSKKHLQEAREAYGRVVTMFAGTPEAEKAEELIADLTEDIAGRAYEAAFADLDGGRYLTAVQKFTKLHSAYPSTYSGLAALANKGVALEKMGDSRQARATYEQVIELTATNQAAEAILKFVRLRLANL